MTHSHTYPEVGEDVLALHILSPELDLAESLILVILQISQRDLENTALQAIGSNLPEPKKSSRQNLNPLKNKNSIQTLKS